MVKEQEHNEKWLLSRGWTKTKGFKIESEEIANMAESDTFFVPSIEDLDGISECTYYELESLEFATDDLDEAIDMQENRDEDNKKT